MFSLTVLFPIFVLFEKMPNQYLLENNIKIFLKRGLFFNLSLISPFLTEKQVTKLNYCSFSYLLSDFVLKSPYIINIVSIIHKC